MMMHPIYAFICEFHLKIKSVFADVLSKCNNYGINEKFIMSIGTLFKFIFIQVPADELLIGTYQDLMIQHYINVLQRWCWDWIYYDGVVRMPESEVLYCICIFGLWMIVLFDNYN